jgi:hypothetical protein
MSYASAAYPGAKAADHALLRRVPLRIRCPETERMTLGFGQTDMVHHRGDSDSAECTLSLTGVSSGLDVALRSPQ